MIRTLFFELVFVPQVSVVVDGAKKALEFSFQGPLKSALRYTFKSRDLHALFDRQWHKLSISAQSNIVSIYIDCKLIERRLTEEKDSIDPSGRTLVTTRVEDGRPVDVCPMQTLSKCISASINSVLSSQKSLKCTPNAFKRYLKHASGAHFLNLCKPSIMSCVLRSFSEVP